MTERLPTQCEEFALAQERLAAASKEDLTHWHHVAVANLLRQCAAALRSSHREGAEAMREACKREARQYGMIKGGKLATKLSALPIPGKTHIERAISRSEAITQLAECLYLKMERMDPGGHGLWENLADDEREFYRASIEEILREKDLLNAAMG